MSKRLLSSRMAKRSRRIRSSGERLSSPGVRDSQSGADSEAPDSLASDSMAPDSLASDSMAPDSMAPGERVSRSSLPAASAASDLDEDRASGEVLSTRRPAEAQPARPSSVPPPARGDEPTDAEQKADAEQEAAAEQKAAAEQEAASSAVSAGATTVPLSVAAVAAIADKGSSDKAKKKGKKNRAAAREPDPRADSGALSLNDAVTRSFYDAPIVAHGDLDDHHDHDHDHDVALPVAMTPELLERKAKLRRIVGGICAAAAVVVVLVAGKAVLDRDDAPAAAPTSNAVTLKSADETARAETARAEAEAAARSRADADARAAEAKAAADAKLAADAKADDAKADDTKADDAKADDAKAEGGAAKSKEEIAALKKTASRLYNTGKLKDAIPALREAIAADPTDALPYLYLGDALTNTGKWKDAREAYNECARNATKGPKSECLVMGGRK